MGYLIIFIPLSLVVGKGHLLVNHTYFFHNPTCCRCQSKHSRSIADVVKMGSNRWANRADHASIFEDILRHEMEKIWMFDLKTGIFD